MQSKVVYERYDILAGHANITRVQTQAFVRRLKQQMLSANGHILVELLF